MKLRSKKTGEVIDLNKGLIMDSMGGREIILGRTSTTYGKIYRYHSLTELTEEWEDYKPKEPLIKDEKIRKAVKAWAEANKETKVKVTGGLLVTVFEGSHSLLETQFLCSWMRNGVYTINELCGEEEE